MRQRGSHRAGTFSAIKAAGIRLIYEHGYEAMTLRMLARSVGLESGSLYYHIKDKQDFLFRLLKEINSRELELYRRKADRFPTEMAQNFWMAIVAWTVCFVVTILVSLVTRPRPDQELVGLVYALTEKPQEGHLTWYQRPVALGVIVLLMTVALNFLFY